MLLTAFQVEAYQLTGPNWLKEARVDIDATLPSGTAREDVPAMLRNLLVERFEMVVRVDARDTELNAVRMTMAELASILARHVDAPVMDRTRLDGLYQFMVELPPNLSAVRGLLSAGITTTVQGTPDGSDRGVDG